jgi:N,N-dimethylformamidase
VRIERDEQLRTLRSFTLSAWIFPTAPERGRQAVMGASGTEGPGYGLFVTGAGVLELRIAHADGRERVVQGLVPLTKAAWHFVAASFDADSGEATVLSRPAAWAPSAEPPPVRETFEPWGDWGRAASPFLIAARDAGVGGPPGTTDSHFNGKIEAPTVHSVALDVEALTLLAESSNAGFEAPEVVARWDFSIGQSTRTVSDRSGNNLTGRTVNLPTRGVTGHNWDGASVSFGERTDLYAAIHFHDDDLDDAGWSTDFSFGVPPDLRSGIYAARLSLDDGARDFVPFFVRPRAGEDRGDLLLLVPTFSYLAYANDHVASDPAVRESLAIGDQFRYPAQPEDHYILASGLTGLYDRHTDGSPVVYSSRLRPVVNMRPTYRQPLLDGGRSGPHQLAADLHLVDWLEHFAYGYHVATDEDLHVEGIECLRRYKVVVTGTHPEYWSSQGLEAVRRYLLGGGRLMYLGGNGFYWVTSVEPEQGHTIEVRKWGGTSAFEVPPGEIHHSTTGELGGLWRFRGRHPQRLVGVGMSAQGVEANAPYRLLPEAADPRAAFMFEGVDPDGLIGDHPSLVNRYGVGGYEIDRFDLDLGTPRHALRVATTLRLSDGYQQVREEIMMADSKQGGTVNPKVRADMVYFECPNGGAVWSVGSIAWCAGLSYNGYENAVSRITRNVLDEFTR